MEDFSQFGEQQVILAWADGRVGSFLDVGAYDGVTYSNTRALALAGWPGIMVEPAPDQFQLLLGGRTGDQIEVQAAVIPEPGDKAAVLYWTKGEPFSSLERRDLEGAQPFMVETVTVEDLVDRWLGQPTQGKPRFLSIDTEGTSVELLRAFLERLGPQLDCVCVEAHENVADERAVALALLEHHGFKVLAQNPVNVIAAS